MIFLSNKGLFTGRYTRSLNIIESPQAEETEFIPTYSNPLQVRASQGGYGVGIVSQQPTGSGTQYATGGSCKCPHSVGDLAVFNPSLATWVKKVTPCNGNYPMCGKCIIWGGSLGQYGYEYQQSFDCNADPPFCGNDHVEYPEQCETVADCEALFGPPPSQSGGYGCSNCQCISLLGTGF